jgi:hypothetical protein
VINNNKGQAATVPGYAELDLGSGIPLAGNTAFRSRARISSTIDLRIMERPDRVGSKYGKTLFAKVSWRF